jgi:DNA-directed RNA polymerase
VKSLEAEQDKVRNGEKGIDRRVYGPYLLLLPPEKLAVIILHTTLSVMMKGEKVKRDNFTGLQLESGKAKLVNMVLHLGEMIQAQSSMVMLEKEVRHGRDVEQKAAMGGVGKEVMASAVVGKGAVGGGAKKRKGTEAEAMAAKERKNSDKLDALSKDLQNIEDVMEARNKARMLLRKVSMYSSPWRRAALLLSSQDWGLETRSKVGAAALQLLLDSALVTLPGDGPDAEPVIEPAFTRSYHYPNQAQHSRYGVIIWHPTIPKLLEDGHAIRESMHPRYMPMLVPPRPWRKYNDGGHLTIQSVVMRGSYSRIGPSPAQLAELKKFEQKAKREGTKGATQVYDALNVLGETRWSMNNPVFKTVTDLWDMGGDTSGLPSR